MRPLSEAPEIGFAGALDTPWSLPYLHLECSDWALLHVLNLVWLCLDAYVFAIGRHSRADFSALIHSHPPLLPSEHSFAGKPREATSRTTVFKRAVDVSYRLKMKASR